MLETSHVDRTLMSLNTKILLPLNQGLNSGTWDLNRGFIWDDLSLKTENWANASMTWMGRREWFHMVAAYELLPAKYDIGK